MSIFFYNKSMSQKIINDVEKSYLKAEMQDFNVGDRVVVHFKIVEGSTERTQLFEGIVIQRRGAGLRATFTVRKISSGIGVERVFPVHSPRIEKIGVLQKGKVRRAKLYYMRDRVGKEALKVKEKYTGNKTR